MNHLKSNVNHRLACKWVNKKDTRASKTRGPTRETVAVGGCGCCVKVFVQREIFLYILTLGQLPNTDLSGGRFECEISQGVNGHIARFASHINRLSCRNFDSACDGGNLQNIKEVRLNQGCFEWLFQIECVVIWTKRERERKRHQ